MDAKAFGLPLYLGKGWMKFLGVVLIGIGVLYGLSIIGLIIAWPLVWMGILLFQAAKHAEAGYIGDDEPLLMAAQWKVKKFFVIAGVSTLVYLVIMLAIFAIMFGLATAKGIGTLLSAFLGDWLDF